MKVSQRSTLGTGEGGHQCSLRYQGLGAVHRDPSRHCHINLRKASLSIARPSLIHRRRGSTHIQVVPLLAVLLILAPIFGHVGHLQSQEALHAGLVTVQQEKKLS